MHTNIPLFGNYIKNVVNYQQCKMWSVNHIK
jgi:hypothetical protein